MKKVKFTTGDWVAIDLILMSARNEALEESENPFLEDIAMERAREIDSIRKKIADMFNEEDE